MAISLNSNVSALAALRRLGNADSAISDSFQRLSSGLRINRPSDDAAGLAVASTLSVQQRIFARAMTNANDGISMLNLAQGSAEQLSSVVMRMKELAQQSANGTLSSTQRLSLNNEAQKLSQEYNRLINSTRFNGLTIHAANQGLTNIQIGMGNSGAVGFELGDALESTAGTGTFTAGSSLNEGVSVADVINADFNNDGILDMVSITTANSKPMLRLGKGNGGFNAATLIAPAGVPNHSLAAGDYDGDGWTDLLVANSTGGVSVMHNVSGTLTLVGTFQLDPGTNGIDRMVMGDVNGDGNLDVIGTANNMLGGLANVSLGNGNGTFGATTVLGSVNGTQSTQVVVADFDADGRMDIATNSASGTGVLVFMSTSKTSGTPSFNTTILTGAGLANVLAVGDMNGDGVSDLLAGKTTSIKTFMSNGNGTFASSGLTNIGAAAIDQLELRDADLDGSLDIYLLDSTSEAVNTYLGNGNGTFQTKQSSSLLAAANSRMTLGDFTGDGILDVAVGTTTGEAVLLGNTTDVTRLLAFDIKTQSAALDALDLLDSQLGKIGNELGRIGAAMSRIGSALSIAGATSENYAAAGSRITDVDVAAETANLTRNQILQQSAAAILAQANQIPSLALTLLNF